MGRGDQKTAKGKRNRGSYGKSRPHKEKKANGARPAAAQGENKSAGSARA